MNMFVLKCVNYRSNKISSHNANRGTAQVSAFNLIHYSKDIFYPNADPPKLAFHNVNPRNPVRNGNRLRRTKVVEDIKETVLNCPEDFILCNRGIDIAVSTIEQKLLSGGDVCQLTITLDNAQLHGILNGGTTYAVLWEMYQDAIGQPYETIEKYGLTGQQVLENMKKAFVWLYPISGIRDKEVLIRAAAGLNTSTQVKETSLDNAKGLFDDIKDSLKSQQYAHRISYAEGDVGDISVRELLQYIELLNSVRYVDEQPTRVYTSSKANEADFVEDWSGNAGKDSELCVKVLVKNLPEVLRVSDLMRQAILNSENYRRLGKRKDGSTACGVGEEEFRFLADASEKGTVFKGFLFPVMSALRANVDISGGDLKWKVPIEDLADCIESVIQVPVSQYRNGTAAEKVGKQTMVYQQCYDQVSSFVSKVLQDARIELLERELELARKNN